MHRRVLSAAGVRALAAPVSALFSVLVMAAGCHGPDGDCSQAGTDGAPDAVPTWTLASEAQLEIGVLAGEGPYQLHGVTSVARLPDGGFVVANGGSDELRFFDAQGRFVARQGRSGKGPAEWESVSRVRLVGGSEGQRGEEGPGGGAPRVRVYDNALRRVGTVALDATFVGSEPMRSDVLFPGDHWLYGRFVVDSPLAPEARGALLTALDRMGARSLDAPAHIVRVTEAGLLWVSSWTSSDAPVEWTVYDLTGVPVARLETPAGFEVHEVGLDWLLGVGRDSLDVQYLRIYELDRGGHPYDPSALATAVAAEPGRRASTPLFRPLKGDSIAHVNGALKSMASHQEIYYSEHFRYASSVNSLGRARFPVELPENVEAQILRAGSDGWAARFVDVDDGRGCMLTYGRFTLVGIPNGSVLCWAPTRTAAADG